MLAERAGVAEGTIYRHFKSKESLLNVVYREVQQWATSLVCLEIERGLRAPDTLRRVARGLIEAAGQSPATVRMLLQTHGERYLDDRSREAAREFRSALEQVIASGKSDGVARAGTAELWASSKNVAYRTGPQRPIRLLHPPFQAYPSPPNIRHIPH